MRRVVDVVALDCIVSFIVDLQQLLFKNILFDMFFVVFILSDKPGTWMSGFFDQDSFIETMTNWAKTVICGRAR